MQHIHIKQDDSGCWSQLWVDGDLYAEDHDVRPTWLLKILEDMGVLVTKENCCLDESCEGNCGQHQKSEE